MQILSSRTNMRAARHLIVLGCTATKLATRDELPAITLYDGPTFRVVKAYLRERRWPSNLSLAVLSAKHGLIGAMSPIKAYERRMTPRRAESLAGSVTDALTRIAGVHRHVDLVLGKDYLRSIKMEQLPQQPAIADGPIGMKLNYLHEVLHSLRAPAKKTPRLPESSGRPLYFLPDWDDFLDADYDFAKDSFSASTRSARREQHSIPLMRPDKLCDGVLVSLAQHLETKKGLLRRISTVGDSGALAPLSIREHFSLGDDQWAFGDCGAFSYSSEAEPTISVKQAVNLYDLHGFDLGASVDHIPLPEIRTNEVRRALGTKERERRIQITRTNAEAFLAEHRARRCSFVPVGVIQGLDAAGYAEQVPAYAEMGYAYVAIGGLVPRGDDDIRDVATQVVAAARRLRCPPSIHLLGIYRPRLQQLFRELGISSFDSATYFRKSWLRSEQNYLASGGRWFSAIRVPPSHDPRTLQRLGGATSLKKIHRLERKALDTLRAYDRGASSIDACLSAVVAYDKLLSRSELIDDKLLASYRETLEARPWRSCRCHMCKALGIEILIFRGLNRNKRRGAHNTLQLYRSVSAPQTTGQC